MRRVSHTIYTPQPSLLHLSVPTSRRARCAGGLGKSNGSHDSKEACMPLCSRRPQRRAPTSVYASLALLLGVTLLLDACTFGSTTDLPAPPTATPTSDAESTAAPGGAPPPVLQAKLMVQTLNNIYPRNPSFPVQVPCPAGYIVASGG